MCTLGLNLPGFGTYIGFLDIIVCMCTEAMIMCLIVLSWSASETPGLVGLLKVTEIFCWRKLDRIWQPNIFVENKFYV